MKTLDEIREELHGMDEDSAADILDEVVHDICSNLAARINNCGVDEQVNFIVEQLGGVAQARAHLLSILSAEK